MQDNMPDQPESSETGATSVGVNLDMLMDVSLAVRIRLGSTSILLRDALNLGPGAILELDCTLDDPVDLIIDGTVIAQGEIVVVNGNYALKIVRVISRRERLGSLGLAGR